ncbi:MAG: SRPBCC domain-containing protein [Acidimicrobiia bacterium]|nr:SRPBCC domain-containing protein [Acidimicrobiia bacterium]
MSDQQATIGRDVELEISIAAPPEAVFEFLVDPDKMTRWMGTSARLDPRTDGEFWVKLGDDATAAGRYLEVDPPNRVVLSWGWEGSEQVPPGSTNVVIELAARDGGTTVRLVHSGLPPVEDDKHLEGWTYFLDRLGIAGAGGDPDAETPTEES